MNPIGTRMYYETCGADWMPFPILSADEDERVADFDKMFMINENKKIIAVVEHQNISVSKIDYVRDTGLAGINWWSLGGDDATGASCGFEGDHFFENSA